MFKSIRKTIGVCSAIIFALNASVTAHAGFSDVEIDSKYINGISYAVSTKIIVGYPDNTFRPYNNINRAELVSMLISSKGLKPDPTKYQNCFSDVKKEWFAPSICYAKAQNWISGYPDNSFAPGKYVNRAESIKIILSILQITSATDEKIQYSDVTSTDWYAKYSSTTKKFNLISEEKFTPNLLVSRGEVAETIFRIKTIKSLSLESYTKAQGEAFLAKNEIKITDLIEEDKTQNPLKSVGESVNFKDIDFSDEANIKKLNGPKVSNGERNIYIGYEQISPNNKDPRLASYTNGKLDWYIKNHETSNDDSSGYGLLWDGKENLYAVFTSHGIQEDNSNSFEKFSKNGWLPQYGTGGGAKVAVITKINPKNGEITNATFLSSVLSSGKSNSILVKDLQFTNGNIKIECAAWWAPRRINKTAMENTNIDIKSPFKYTIELSADLSTAISAAAPEFGK